MGSVPSQRSTLDVKGYAVVAALVAIQSEDCRSEGELRALIDSGMSTEDIRKEYARLYRLTRNREIEILQTVRGLL